MYPTSEMSHVLLTGGVAWQELCYIGSLHHDVTVELNTNYLSLKRAILIC